MDDPTWIDGLGRIDFMVDESTTGATDVDFSMGTQRDKFLGGGNVHKETNPTKGEMTSTSQRIDIGHLIKQENKDVSHFTRKPLWSGSASEFLDNGRETPATIIQQ